MKCTLSTLLLGLFTLGFVGCGTPDRPRTDATIGSTSSRSAPAAAGHIGTREFDTAIDREIGADDFTNFNALSDYDYVLTPQERTILRARAREQRANPDNYLGYLTEAEKANLRERAQRLH